MSRRLGRLFFALSIGALPLAMACGGGDEGGGGGGGAPPPAPHTHYGGGGGDNIAGATGGFGLPGGGGRLRGSGGGGGALASHYADRHREREEMMRRRREGMGPIRLTDEGSGGPDHPNWPAYRAVVEAAAARMRPEDDDCEHSTTMGDAFNEELRGHGLSAREEREANAVCGSMPEDARRCNDDTYRANHAEECGRAEARGRRVSRAAREASTGTARDSDMDRLRDALRGERTRARGVASELGHRVEAPHDDPDDAPPPTGSSGALGEPDSLMDETVAPDGEDAPDSLVSDEPLAPPVH